MQLVERYIESKDWITILFTGCLVLFSIARYAYPKRFIEFVMLPINNKYFFVHGKNDDLKHPFNALLFITQVISISLFIFLLMKISRPTISESNPWLFVQICTGYSIFVLLKLTFEKIIGYIFNVEFLVNSYIYQKLSYRNVLSTIVLLANLIFFYTFEPSLSVLIGFSIVILVLNSLALFYSYKSFGNIILRNFFYFILYLCALEISPYIIIYKVFQG